MFEAVNSVLSNASLLRGQAEQTTAARAIADQQVTKAPQAPFVSPYIHVDLNYDKAVLQIRDSETGDVVNQFPSQGALETRQAQAVAQAQKQVTAQRSEPAVSQSSLLQAESVPAVQQQAAPAAPAQQTQAPQAQAAATALSTASQSGAPQATTFATEA